MHIVLADDHEVVRTGCRRLLEGDTSISAIDEADSTDYLLTLLSITNVDLVVLDLSLPSSGGMECLKRLAAKYPDLKVLIFTIYDNPLLVERCIQAGALGYVTKSSDSKELVAAIHAVGKGSVYISQDMANVLAVQKLSQQDSKLSVLSPRELDIFIQVAHGNTVKVIANNAFLAEKTISNYISQIKGKLSVDSTAKWVHIALEHNLIAKRIFQ